MIQVQIHDNIRIDYLDYFIGVSIMEISPSVNLTMRKNQILYI